MFFRLPHSFCVLKQAQKYCPLVHIGLFRQQIGKVLDVALSDEFIDHDMHSIEAPHRLTPRIQLSDGGICLFNGSNLLFAAVQRNVRCWVRSRSGWTALEPTLLTRSGPRCDCQFALQQTVGRHDRQDNAGLRLNLILEGAYKTGECSPPLVPPMPFPAGACMTQSSEPDLMQRLAVAHQRPVVRKGRNVAAGNLRGWSLEFSDLLQRIATIPEFAAAHRLAAGRSLVTTPKLANLFLIMRFTLHAIPGDVVEFGSYRGGSALFIAHLLRAWGSTKKVFALDTFEGLPPTDHEIDLHRSGDFADATLEEVTNARDAAGLADQLVLVKGLFEDRWPTLRKGRTFSLAHIDCDIYHAVKYVLQEIDDSLSPGAHVILDDPLFGSCLGAMEACEEVYIQTKGLHAEQTYPHLVFRPKGV